MVGAGFRTTTASLYSGDQKRWVCLEPDLALARWRIVSLKGISPSVVRLGGNSVRARPRKYFDPVIYVVVLEHVEDDKTEARLAAGRLREGGALVVQAPSSSGSLLLSTRHWDTTAGAT